MGKIQCCLKSDKNNWYFTLRPMYILIISHWILLIMRNVSDKKCRDQNTHFMYNKSLTKIIMFLR